MSWSLSLSNGDFSPNGSQLAVVTDGNKLLQDLRCAVLTKMGTDDMHTDYGSLIDGGTTPDGTMVQSLIGTATPTQASQFINTEMQRISTAYRNAQLARAQADQQTYGRATLTPGEVLLGINDVQSMASFDTLTVVLDVQSAADESLAMALPVASS